MIIRTSVSPSQPRHRKHCEEEGEGGGSDDDDDAVDDDTRDDDDDALDDDDDDDENEEAEEVEEDRRRWSRLKGFNNFPTRLGEFLNPKSSFVNRGLSEYR